MLKKHSQTKNQTFSIPIEISQDLHTYVKKREMSRFVSDAIRKELEARKNDLKNAYHLANEDQGQIESMKEWEITLLDGLDDF